MNCKFTLLISFVTLVCFTACNSEKGNQFHISGTIEGMPSMKVLIREVGFQNSKFVDSTHSDKDGHFELSGRYTKSGIYSIKMGTRFLTVVIDQPVIEIQSKWNHFYELSVIGSPATRSLHAFNNGFRSYSKRLVSLRMAHDSLFKQGASDSLLKILALKTDQANKTLITFIKSFSDTVKSLPVAIYVASNLLTTNETDFLISFTKKLNTRFPNNDPTLEKDFKNAVETKIASMKSKNRTPVVGSVAPDFQAKSSKGKMVSLSDFKGQFVLLDFWASWCPPCRAENPNVVAAYKQYRNKNFTVVSFSLDKDKKKWVEAVERDQLTWPQLSDLKGWSSSIANLYGIEAIPMNFLINPEGKIIARNLRGSRLDAALAHALLEQDNQDSVTDLTVTQK